MPICAVTTCGERGQFACKKSEGQIISFHRFPSDKFPRIKAKWIRATGQRKTTYSWQPTKESTICSKHFKKEDFLSCTDLKISAVPISEALLDDHDEKELFDGFAKDYVENCDTNSSDDIIELPQYNQIIRNKEFTEEDKVEYEPANTTSPYDQLESNQPIAIQDSEPELSETSSELEFTELDSSEAKSSQPSVDAIENPQGTKSDELPVNGIKISKPNSTRKRLVVQMKDQIKTNIKMYRIDPVTNTVLPVKSVPKDSLFVDLAKPPVIIRRNRNQSEKPYYLMKKSNASLDGNSQKTIETQNCSSQLQCTNNTSKIISIGSNSKRVINLLKHKEEQKKVYSTPVPKLFQINQTLPAKKADLVQKICTATKLNPTTETAGRVKKHRKHKLNSITKKITPSAKMLTLASSHLSKPKGTVSKQAPAVPRSTTSMATPADSMRTSTVSTPTSTVSTPSPAYSMSTPANSTQTPAILTPSPTISTPSPANSITISADSTPTRTDSIAIPADSTATPADSSPTRDDSMPIPAEPTPTPTDSLPTPAVQKLNDWNIHTPDEYDTFAKHVATQLRQLTLESYLSAQAEIQSILSKYRLSDLNVIKNVTQP